MIKYYLLFMKEKRLRDRNTETAESLQKRLDTAKAELEYGLYFHCLCCQLFLIRCLLTAY
jgi:guanylate kinase